MGIARWDVSPRAVSADLTVSPPVKKRDSPAMITKRRVLGIAYSQLPSKKPILFDLAHLGGGRVCVKIKEAHKLSYRA
jgi:hypothetical protein